MTDIHECEWCDRPAPFATICGACVKTLRKALANVSADYADLGTVRRKGTRFGGNSTKGSIGKEQPLPIDGRFADRAGDGSQLDFDVKNTVVTWARAVMDEYAETFVGPICEECQHESCLRAIRRRWPSSTVTSVCAYLSRMAPTIAAEDWVAAMLDEVLDLERRLRRFVDRPADRWYAGVCDSEIEADRPHDGTTCGCGCHNDDDAACDMDGGCGVEYATIEGVRCTRELWADGKTPFVHCRDCGTSWDVEQRRVALVREAEDREATVRTLARIITTLGASDAGEARVESRINTWVHRGRLTANGRRVIDGKVRPVYRVGDVLALLRRDDEKRSA